MSTLECIDFEQYLRSANSQSHLIDVRSPIEFSKANVPNSSNVPILDDLERSQVGTTYKTHGASEAKKLGYCLVSGDKKTKRVQGWKHLAETYPQAAIFCARGGLRSQISQQWLMEAGVCIPRITGGYKAIRNYLLSSIERDCASLNGLILSGLTGSAKTRLLYEISNPTLACLDLEKLANHRGSAFGSCGQQPAQSTFENTLSLELGKIANKNPAFVLIESESRSIGRNWLPDCFLELMNRSDCVELEIPLENRAAHIVDEYIVEPFNHAPEDKRLEVLDNLRLKFEDSLFRIKKRLGGQRTTAITKMLDEAFTSYRHHQEAKVHYNWVSEILEKYYDPLYKWQLNKCSRKILFKGNYQEVQEFLNNISVPSR